MTFLFYLFLFIFFTVGSVLCLVVLVQESKTMGLGASFGGDAGNSLFGTSTASVLKKFTSYLATVFMALCFILSLWTTVLGRASQKAPKAVIEETSDAS